MYSAAYVLSAPFSSTVSTFEIADLTRCDASVIYRRDLFDSALSGRLRTKIVTSELEFSDRDAEAH